MTDPIAGEIRPRVSYVADGVARSFTFPFPILAAADLAVKVGAFDVAPPHDVSGVGAATGGEVTFATAPAAGTRIVLYRDTPVQRGTLFSQAGELRASALNAELDRLVMLVQDLSAQVQDVLRVEPGEEDAALLRLPPATERANRLLSFDAAGAPRAVPSPDAAGLDVFAGLAQQAQDAAAEARSVADASLNWAINGTFSVNQRKAATRAQPVGVYGYDRWRGHADGLEQIVESLPADTYTLAWSGGGNGRLAGGAPAPSPITATLPGSHTSIVVPTDAQDVALYPGTVSRPPQPRPAALELLLCQRYYVRLEASAATPYVRLGAGVCIEPTQADIVVAFPIFMRDVPSVQVSGATLLRTSGVHTPTGYYVQKISRFNCEFIVTSTGLTPGEAAFWAAGNDPDAFVAFDAEF